MWYLICLIPSLLESNFNTSTQNNLQGHGCDTSKTFVYCMKTDPLENTRFVFRLILKYAFPLNMADKFPVCQKRHSCCTISTDAVRPMQNVQSCTESIQRLHKIC